MNLNGAEGIKPINIYYVEIADTCNTVEPLPTATNGHNSYSFHTFIN